ncbi:MAG: hypothetical protein IPO04_04655 [Cytophagaceae bacterium]|nr:hypothetical protein [Cytophagaceae bacterium]
MKKLLLSIMLFPVLIYGQNQVLQSNNTSFTITPEGILSSKSNSPENLRLGFDALKNNTQGYNIAFGNSAMANGTGGTFNIAIGSSSLYGNSGKFNVGIGGGILNSATAGSYNTAVGNSALGITYGSKNTAIGYQAGYGTIDSPDSSGVYIGYQAGKNEPGSNKLYISNNDTPDPLIWGDFWDKKLAFHGNVGINTKDPQQKLQIDNGGIRLRNTSDNKNWEWNYDETNNYTYFDEFGVGRKLFIRNGSNPLVGIGVAPNYNLHIRSNNPNTNMFIDNAGGGMEFSAAFSESSINQTSGRFSLKTNTLDRLTIFPTTLRIGLNVPSGVNTLDHALVVYDASTEYYSSIRIIPTNWQAQSVALMAFGDLNHYIKSTHSVGLQIHDVNRIKLTGSNVGIGDSEPDTKLEVDGYTMLGSDAPKIKTKFYEENALMPALLRTSVNEGGVELYDLGISSTRILAVNIFVDYGSQPLTALRSDDLVPPSYSATNGYQFDYVLNGNTIEIKNHPTNSENILGKYVRIFITYRE